MLKKIKQLLKKENQPELTIEDKIEDLFEKTFLTDVIRLELGTDYLPFGEDICAEIDNYRTSTAEKYAFIFPPIHVISNDSLQENEIKLFIQEKEIITDFWIPNKKQVLIEVNKLLEKMYNNNLEDIFTNEFFEKIINKAQINNSWLIWNLSCRYTGSELKDVFISILKHKKSIKNSEYILAKIEEIRASVSTETLVKIIANELP